MLRLKLACLCVRNDFGQRRQAQQQGEGWRVLWEDRQELLVEYSRIFCCMRGGNIIAKKIQVV